MNEYLMIGTVLKPQGVRGECKIRSYAADIGFFHRWTTLYLKDENGYTPVSLQTVRIRDGFVYAYLDHSDNADAAERYRGADLYIDRNQAAPAGKDAVLIADLIGCEARDEKNEVIGTLTDVLQHGTVDVWVFRSGNSTLMAPALKDVFPEVYPERKLITVNSIRLGEVGVWS